MSTDSLVPRLPVGDVIESAYDWVDDHLGAFFDLVSDLLDTIVSSFSEALVSPPALVTALVLALIAWGLRGWRIGVGALVGLAFVASMGQWENAMQTLALVLVATVVSLLIGVPLGVLAARFDGVSRAVKPVMDLMQTMPAFVWLVPVVSLFGIGVQGGLVATVIFALPPGVRLTELGIRGVDPEVVEAGHAFGSPPRDILRSIQLPLALPTVMAGVNQVIMLALSMAVIAGLVGGGGLGGAVVAAIGRLDVGLAFEAGLSVVVLAVYLDRATAAIGRRRAGNGLLRRLRRRATTSNDAATQDKEPSLANA